jgi:ribosomal protein S18 acetylase RimI-like enzyme
MDYLESFAKKEKMEFLTLRVMPKNEPAIKLYEKLGFVNKGSTKQGDLLMKKSLV